MDPASATLIISTMIRGFVAFGMVLEQFWYRITGVFTGGGSKTALAADAVAPTSEADEDPLVWW